MRFLLAGTLATLTAAGLAAIRPAVLTDEERTAALAIRDSRMRADIRFLSSDLLEGRGPATRGDRLARAYLASRFEAIGLEPGAPGGAWEQPFDLVGSTAACPRVLRVARGDAGEDLRFLEDYVAFSGVQASEATLRRRRDRVRRLRHRGARARVGRLQGGGPPGPRAPVPEQRAGGGPAPLRREAPALLRPLGLQVRDGGEARRRGRDHPPHRRLGRLRVEGRPRLVDRRAVLAARRARRAGPRGEGLGDGGGGPAHRPPRRPRPRRSPRRGRGAHVPSGAPRRAGEPLAEERGPAPLERERDRPPARPRPGALARGRRLHRPPRPLRHEARPVGRDRRLQRRPRQRLGPRRPAGDRRGLRRPAPSGRAGRSSSPPWPRRSTASSARTTWRGTRRCRRAGWPRPSTWTA